MAKQNLFTTHYTTYYKNKIVLAFVSGFVFTDMKRAEKRVKAEMDRKQYEMVDYNRYESGDLKMMFERADKLQRILVVIERALIV